MFSLIIKGSTFSMVKKRKKNALLVFINGPAGTGSVTFSLPSIVLPMWTSKTVSAWNSFIWASAGWHYINQTHLTKTHLLKHIKAYHLRVCCPQSLTLTENSRTSVRTQSLQTQTAWQVFQQAVQGTFPPPGGKEFNCRLQHQHPGGEGGQW